MASFDQTNPALANRLARLAERSLEGADRYQVAADKAQNAYYTEVFRLYADRRAAFAGELNDLIARLGGTPVDGAESRAGIERLWLNVLSLVTAGDRVLVEECSRVDSAMLDEYHTLLRADLPEPVQETVRRHAAELRTARKHIQQVDEALH